MSRSQYDYELHKTAYKNRPVLSATSTLLWLGTIVFAALAVYMLITGGFFAAVVNLLLTVGCLLLWKRLTVSALGRAVYEREAIAEAAKIQQISEITKSVLETSQAAHEKIGKQELLKRAARIYFLKLGLSSVEAEGLISDMAWRFEVEQLATPQSLIATILLHEDMMNGMDSTTVLERSKQRRSRLSATNAR